jgi:hypothetical protein
MKTIRPLLAFHNLTKIEINPVRCGIGLDDVAIMEFGKAWPHLQVLDLGTYHGWGHKGISLKALVSLIARCPDLNTLNIVIDGTLVKRYSLDKPGGTKHIRNEAITSLTIGDSRIRHPASVAAFMSDILPNVEEISAWKSVELAAHNEARKYRIRWQEVAKLLVTFAMVRDQERIWKDDSTEDDEHSSQEDEDSMEEVGDSVEDDDSTEDETSTGDDEEPDSSHTS